MHYNWASSLSSYFLLGSPVKRRNKNEVPMLSRGHGQGQATQATETSLSNSVYEHVFLITTGKYYIAIPHKNTKLS